MILGARCSSDAQSLVWSQQNAIFVPPHISTFKLGPAIDAHKVTLRSSCKSRDFHRLRLHSTFTYIQAAEGQCRPPGRPSRTWVQTIESDLGMLNSFFPKFELHFWNSNFIQTSFRPTIVFHAANITKVPSTTAKDTHFKLCHSCYNNR